MKRLQLSKMLKFVSISITSHELCAQIFIFSKHLQFVVKLFLVCFVAFTASQPLILKVITFGDRPGVMYGPSTVGSFGKYGPYALPDYITTSFPADGIGYMP